MPEVDLTHSPSATNVRTFGAVGDGKNNDTQAIRAALEQAVQSGTRRLVIPPGVYLCGTLQLPSDFTLEVQTGATLLASPDPEDFPVLDSEVAPQHDHGHRHLIAAAGARNLTICGGGAIDGNAAVYRPAPETRAPSSWYGFAGPTRFVPMVNLARCEDVRIENITLRDSPGWTCHLFCCERAWVRGVRLINDVYAGNSDGFDVNGCRDVFFSDCWIETGDDAIVLKTTRGSQSCERILVTNCSLRSNCAAFKIGTESWHDFRQITVSNCVMRQSGRGIQLMSQDGATIEDVTVSNVMIDTNIGVPLMRPIHVAVHKRRGKHEDGAKSPQEQRLGAIRNVSFSNINIVTDGRILITGADGAMPERVTLRDISIRMPWIEDPQWGRDCDMMQSSPGNPEARLAPATLVLENLRDVQVSGLRITWPAGPTAEGLLPKVEKGAVVVDPSTTEKARFHAIWSRNVEGGAVDTRGLTASWPGGQAIVSEPG